jgi:hypothetical protein
MHNRRASQRSTSRAKRLGRLIWNSRLVAGALSKLGEILVVAAIAGIVAVAVFVASGNHGRDVTQSGSEIGGPPLVLSPRMVGDYPITPMATVDNARRAFGRDSLTVYQQAAGHECTLSWRTLGLQMTFSSAAADACRRGVFCKARATTPRWRLLSGLAIGESQRDILSTYRHAREFPRHTLTTWILDDSYPQCGTIAEDGDMVGRVEALTRRGAIVALTVRGWGAGE